MEIPWTSMESNHFMWRILYWITFVLISILHKFNYLQIFWHRSSLLFGHLDKGIEPGTIFLENVTTPVNQLIAHFHITPTESGTKLACIQTKDTKTYACIFLLTDLLLIQVSSGNHALFQWLLTCFYFSIVGMLTKCVWN